MCMLISALPNVAPVSAVEAGEIPTFPITETTTGPEETFAAIGSTPSSDLSIIQEEVSLRKEYEKHFLMSDGSYQVALYNEPIHQLKDGEWVEIDNTLALQTAVDGTAQYRTANGLADVSFAQSYGEQLVSMQKDEHSISWGVQAVSSDSTMSATASTESLQPVQAELVPADTSSLSADEQKAFAVKSSSAIRYHDALREDVDLEYIVLPSRIKENIILQSPQDISYYVVTVYTENLSAQLLENRRIEFYDSSDEVVFTMSSPYMYDSAAELSENITVEMTSKGDGCYLIKMTPDAQWLNDQDRVYPVVIDPELSADTTQQNIIDNYVLEGSGVQNNNLDRLYIGVKSGYKARAYIQYATMPTLPSGSTITAASMTVQILSGTSTANNASAYMVTGADWASGTITWDNKPAASTLLASNISHNSKTRYTFSCKTAVQTWYSGSTTGQNKNYGVMIRYYDETIADYNSVYSADYSDETKRPALTITYQPSSSSVSVLEGSTYTLSVPNVTETITWSSSNTAVATVNASGKVTGVKAGKATITASTGSTVQKTFTVYVRILSGVYYIKQGENLYLGTTGRVAENTGTSLYTKSTSSSTQLRQLWKITYLADGYYSIRPMYKLDMGLHATSNTVDITTISTSDTLNSISSSNRWRIEHSSDGYIFRHSSSSSLAMRANPYYGASATTATYSSGSSSFHWDLERIIDINPQVILINTSTGSLWTDLSYSIAPCGSMTLDSMSITAAFVSVASNDQTITWESLSPDVVMVDPSSGTITGIDYQKSAVIRAYHDLYGTRYSKSYGVTVRIAPYSPPLKPQEQSQWCWAAVAQMLALDYAPSITATQSDAVRAVKGSVVNKDGDQLECEEAAEYLLSTVSNGTNIAYTAIGTILTENALSSYLDDGHAVAIFRGMYSGDDVNSWRMGGHALLVSDYITVDGVKRYMVFDPLPVNEGTIRWLSYDDIVSEEDQGVRYFWDAVIAEDTSYFYDTISIKE